MQQRYGPLEADKDQPRSIRHARLAMHHYSIDQTTHAARQRMCSAVPGCIHGISCLSAQVVLVPHTTRFCLHVDSQAHTCMMLCSLVTKQTSLGWVPIPRFVTAGQPHDSRDD
jgi:hypothetical protein